jgi:hypothetical protein
MVPEVKFWPHMSDPYFKTGGKQRWVIKQKNQNEQTIVSK